MTQQALVPSQYSSLAEKPFCELVPCHQRHHKTPPHSMGTRQVIQQALWYKYICYMFSSTSKYFTRNVNYLQEGLPHGKGKKKNLILKVIAHTLKEGKKKCIFNIGLTPLTGFLNSHRSKVATYSERATWGKCFCEKSA